ncbi:MSHA biogenesis protein MshK [Psychrobium sp. nBUS_13]|uniref:MSHA biogenesis protein MshK n=1 Tax=Psychrobium sp. nBUS_13 TaxID=3395319 RepID=UPI003EBA6478
MLKHSYRILLALLFLGSVWLVNAANDPTKPPVLVQKQQRAVGEKVESGQVTLNLNAIQIKTKSKTAIINGQSLRVGQSIAGQVITSISKNKVMLASGKELNLFDTSQITVAKKGL